ncbi:MAG: alpha/beta fold hydrolase [Mariprofundaceae bacterium]
MSMPLVFLHGWGQSVRIWQMQTEYFSPKAEVYAMNLPGHGDMPDAPADAWLDALAGEMPAGPSMLVGWSLGGLLAMQMALEHPEHIAGLVLVSATPCFCSRADWPHGCADHVFAGFEQGIATQTDKTMHRFFALMLHGDTLTRPEHNHITQLATDRSHLPTLSGLQAGLALLSGLDLRENLQQINCPVLIMHGDRDAIIPIAAGHYLAEHIPDTSWLPFRDCGHTPFLSRPEHFNEQLEAWCQTISSAQQG